MKITAKRLKRLIREALLQESLDTEYYVAVSLENAARNNPGVDGRNLLRIVRQDPEYSSVLQGVSDETIWEIADEMIEEDTLFFDVEEDAWYYAPEKIVAEALLKEEEADFYKDYKRGSISYEEYKQLVRDFQSNRGAFSGGQRRPARERPQWLVDQIMAVEASIKLKPNNFLTSILQQLKRPYRGRSLSEKQVAVVKKILGKQNPEWAELF
tara:strand:+ start:302 stop:937 length:636 start_codon:yes stop_codon:yes gene_type:complete